MSGIYAVTAKKQSILELFGHRCQKLSQSAMATNFSSEVFADFIF